MSWAERREGWTPQLEDARLTGDVDYARIIHSASFRRLQGKTQILNLGDSDFYRTRLTHSLEVAQIAGGISRQLRQSFPDHPAIAHLPEHSQIQAIGSAHDLGHPPFGHGGETALNYCMRDHGGFEGNGQTLRILARLENFSEHAGANLSRRTLLGLLKYPINYSTARNPKITPSLHDSTSIRKIINNATCKPPKCYLNCENDVVNWILKKLSAQDRDAFTQYQKQDKKHHKALHKSLDCSIMDCADDIAYGVHDLEDAIALDLITREAFKAALEGNCETFLAYIKKRDGAKSGNDILDYLTAQLFGGAASRKHFISRMVHHFVTAVELYDIADFEEPLLRYRVRIAEERQGFLDALQKLLVDNVILSPSVQQLEFKGQQMVVAVFETLAAEPDRLLPLYAQKSYRDANGDPRIICDYVASMTDASMLKIYERLYSPHIGSVFDSL